MPQLEAVGWEAAGRLNKSRASYVINLGYILDFLWLALRWKLGPKSWLFGANCYTGLASWLGC